MIESRSKLDYATQPAGSRIDVAVDGDTLVLSQRPIGWWFNARWGLLNVLIYVLIFTALIAWIVLRYNAAPILQQLPLIRQGLSSLLIALGLVFAFCFVVGRLWMTIRLTPHEVELIRGVSFLSRTWSRRRTIPWRDIERVESRRFGSTVELFNHAGRRCAHLMLHKRADAQWVAQLIRKRANEAHSSAGPAPPDI